MSVAIVTGSGGLVGSVAVTRLAADGFDVVGLDNDMRGRFFGADASTAGVSARLAEAVPGFRWVELDIRDAAGVRRVFSEHAGRVDLVVHAAAQPSHDWAARDPATDFQVNAVGTLNVLEAARASCPDATFAYLSTNKVYGDTPNRLPLEELETRLELPETHPYRDGIDTTMPIDRSTHSLMGVSKTSGDLLVQEYGRYFSMPTVSFRCGCISGPTHAGAMLHGFLAYLMRCTVAGDPYTVFGYGGKQVRDNIHAEDLVAAILAFHERPRPAAVYNLGGGRQSNCSLLEAIAACERIAGKRLDWTLAEEPRVGDHRWWISNVEEFRADYPRWRIEHGIESILAEIHAANAEAWASPVES